MKRTLMLLAAGIFTFILAACGAHAPTLPALTFPQAVALVCGDGDAAINIMIDDGLFTGGALDTLNKEIRPAFDKVCTKGATVTVVDLRSLTSTTLPLLRELVTASNLQEQTKSQAKTAIDLTAFAINTAVALQPQTTAAGAAATGAPASAASQ